MGRVTASNQIMLGQTYTFAYTYNLAGSVATETYPHGGVQTITYDGANRPYSTSGSLPPHTTQYIQQAAYAPDGAVSSYVRGNNVWHVVGYNNRRFQPTEVYESLNNTNSLANMYTVSCLNWGVQPNFGGALYPLCPVTSGTNDNGNLQSATFSTWWSRFHPVPDIQPELHIRSVESVDRCRRGRQLGARVRL